MEPFSISCTTCQAKLRVRDRSAIGQILTCPKCGSMVLIEAPPGTGAVSSPATDSPSAPKSGIPSATRPPRPAGPAKRPGEFADTVDDPTHYGAGENPDQNAASKVESLGLDDSAVSPDIVFNEAGVFDETAVTSDGGGSHEASAATSLAEEVPDEEWLTSRSRQRRRWLLAGVALLAGVLLAIATFVLVVGRGAKPVAQPSPSAVVPHDSSPPSTTTPPADLSPEPPTEPPAPATTFVPLEPAPSEPAPTVPAPTVPAPTVPAPSEPAPPASPTALPKPPDPPLELVPRDGDVANADRMAPGGALTDTLRKLGGLFDEDKTPAKPTEPAADPGAATPGETPLPVSGEPMEEVPPDGKTPGDSAAGGAVSRPKPRVVDTATRLKDPLVEVDFPGTPLQDFLLFVNAYSTIPVTLDPDVLVWLKLTPDTPVTLKLADTTVASLLDAALGNLGLIAVPTNQQILVTRKPVGGEGLRKAQRKADDLLGGSVGGDDERSRQLRSLLTSLVAPGSWSDAGGAGKVTIDNGQLQLEQTDAVLLETSALLERLRVARGLPKQSKFPEKLFLPVTRTARAASALDKSVTLNYPRPTSFPKIVRRLSLESGISILIDWQAVAEAGWNPDAEATLTATAKPLREALAGLLTPMELTYRVVDESLLQITTPAALASRNEIEFYPVGELLGEPPSEEAFLKQMQAALPPEWLAATSGSGVLKFDPPSRCLIALLPQPRQQVVEKLLQKWKAPRR